MRRPALAALVFVSLTAAAAPVCEVVAATDANTAAASMPATAALRDLESRIEYGYYTEDGNALETLARETARSAAQGPDEPTARNGLRSYYSALADYRLALLELGKADGRARADADQCVSSLDHTLDTAGLSNSASAESLALQSACLALLSDLGSWRAPFSGARSKSQMRKALKLAPANPRVLLLDAVGAVAGTPDGAAREVSLGKLRKAIAALEGERQQVVHAPSWGLADAYARLGRLYLEKGDTVAARDALERALLTAPQFRQARRMMTKITIG